LHVRKLGFGVWAGKNGDLERALEEEAQDCAAEIAAGLIYLIQTSRKAKFVLLTPAMTTFFAGIVMVK
jgi:hypothetical protein